MKMKRNYKDGVFRKLFNDKEKLLELYNALSGSNYPPDTEIEIVTLDDVIFGGAKNDLSFIIGNRFIVLIEHQSTISPNMPLRMGDYIFKQFEQLVNSGAIYSKRLVPLPTPELYVFYNGPEELPPETELKLSDAFMQKCDKLSMEVVVKVINVNYEAGAEILERCRTLNQYSRFISMMRKAIKEAKTDDDRETAYKEVVKTCIRQGILADFLKKYGGAIMSFLFDELSREECEAIRAADGYMEGLEDGKAEGEVIGKCRGMREMLIEMTLAKLAQGQSAEQISGDLLQPEGTIREIVSAAGKFPEKTAGELYTLIHWGE